MPKIATYTVDIPDNCQVVFFANGILARNRHGLLWLWRNLFKIRQAVSQSPNCLHAKAGIVSSHELILNSWWQSKEQLHDFMKSQVHMHWMQYLIAHPKDLTIWNETYQVTQSGKYLHDPHGLAAIFAKKQY